MKVKLLFCRYIHRKGWNTVTLISKKKTFSRKIEFLVSGATIKGKKIKNKIHNNK